MSMLYVVSVVAAVASVMLPVALCLAFLDGSGNDDEHNHKEEDYGRD